MSIGSRIRDLRKKYRLTQRQMAERLGMGSSNFGHIENDRVTPTSKDLVKIALMLNTTTDYLLGNVDDDRIPGSGPRQLGLFEDLPVEKSAREQALDNFYDYDNELNGQITELLLSLSHNGCFYEFLKDEVFYLFKNRADYNIGSMVDAVETSRNWDWKERIIESLKSIYTEHEHEIEERESEFISNILETSKNGSLGKVLLDIEKANYEFKLRLDGKVLTEKELKRIVAIIRLERELT